MNDGLVALDVHDHIATITLSSSGNRNALSEQLRHELNSHLTTALDDDAVRVLVLTHSGPVFCAGMDLDEAAGLAAGEQGVKELPELLERLWTSPKPVLARVAGRARGAGIGLVAACDIAVAAEDADFAFSEVRVGVVPAVVSATVTRRMLPRPLHELLLTGETFDARRAAAAGLLNAVVPASELDAEVRRYADMLMLGAPGALAATKEMLYAPRSPSMRGDLDATLEVSARHFASEEGQEGIRAFKEERPAAWVPRGAR